MTLMALLRLGYMGILYTRQIFVVSVKMPKTGVGGGNPLVHLMKTIIKQVQTNNSLVNIIKDF